MTTSTHNARATSFSLKDVTFHYVNLANPITPSFTDGIDGPQWSVQVRDINEDAAMDLKELGLPIKYDTELSTFVMSLKQYTQNAKGVAQSLNVVDGDYEDIPMETRETIGFGSKGHLAGFFYTYNNDSGTGISARMTDVVINELVVKTVESKEERFARLFG